MSHYDLTLNFELLLGQLCSRTVEHFCLSFFLFQTTKERLWSRYVEIFWTSISKSSIWKIMPAQIIKYAVKFHILCQSEWNYASQNRLTCCFQFYWWSETYVCLSCLYSVTFLTGDALVLIIAVALTGCTMVAILAYGVMRRYKW